MQQKYCDQGRSSVAVDHHVHVRSASPGVPAVPAGSPERRRSFLGEELHRLSRGMRDPVDVRGGPGPRTPPCWRGKRAGHPSSCTATVFPFRSRIARTRSVPNSSKQPTWPPARITTGSPASSRTMNGAAKCMLMSASPEARADSTPEFSSFLTYCTSVNPSSRSSSSATYCGAPQMPLGSGPI